MQADLPSPIVQSQVHAAEIADVWHDRHVTDAEALRAVEAAVPVLRALQLRPSRYRATVSRDDGAFSVDFIDKAVPRDTTARGNPGKVPGLKVRLDPRRLVPIGHSFIR